MCCGLCVRTHSNMSVCIPQICTRRLCVLRVVCARRTHEQESSEIGMVMYRCEVETWGKSVVVAAIWVP